jgi:hypothetical protein
MWLGDGGLTRVAKRTKRTLGHVSQVNKGIRPDAVVERAIVKAITKNNPNIAPADVWPERVSA